MNEDQYLSFLIIFGLLLLSYVPVNRCIGASVEKMLFVYFMSLMFRGLCILGSFLNGARQDVLVSIVLAVIIEVGILVRMSMAEEQAEVLS